MKKVIFCLLVSLIAQNQLIAQPISLQQSETALRKFLQNKQSGHVPLIADSISGTNGTLARIYTLAGNGFVIVAAQKQLETILAYSFTSSYRSDEKSWNELLPILTADYSGRLAYAVINPAYALKNIQNRDAFLQNSQPNRDFQQWPPAGTTPTGGWLWTNWTQSAPYNMLCPMDNTTGQRSYTGCPSTAMAQILNLHRRLNHTRFTDADDYHHIYGGNNFWFDDDYNTFKFPSWPKLNRLLDTLETHYDTGITPSDSLAAALTFACGVAAKQVYSSSGSGTWGIDQALMAYQRFGFVESVLVLPDDTTLNEHLADNIKIGIPAHLGLVDPGVTVGHNVVVDGYNTDEFYHFNFGWGGSANGWYTMPPTSIPYNLTVIEGIVLDIDLENHTTGVHYPQNTASAKIHIYTNSSDIMVITDAGYGNLLPFEIYSTDGKLLQTDFMQKTSNHQYTIRHHLTHKGIYFLRIKTSNGFIATGKFLF